jgi:hypothetical protein
MSGAEIIATNYIDAVDHVVKGDAGYNMRPVVEALVADFNVTHYLGLGAMLAKPPISNKMEIIPAGGEAPRKFISPDDYNQAMAQGVLAATISDFRGQRAIGMVYAVVDGSRRTSRPGQTRFLPWLAVRGEYKNSLIQFEEGYDLSGSNYHPDDIAMHRAVLLAHLSLDHEAFLERIEAATFAKLDRKTTKAPNINTKWYVPIHEAHRGTSAFTLLTFAGLDFNIETGRAGLPYHAEDTDLVMLQFMEPDHVKQLLSAYDQLECTQTLLFDQAHQKVIASVYSIHGNGLPNSGVFTVASPEFETLTAQNQQAVRQLERSVRKISVNADSLKVK